MKETEMFIPQAALESNQAKTSEAVFSDNAQPFTAGPKKDIMAYPASWADNFGSNFYRHAQARELSALNREGLWDVNREGQPYNDSPGLNVTTTEVVSSQIKQIICDMKQGAAENGE